MDKIEVGEYVRTKDGIIAKVTDILKEYCIDCDNDVFDLYNGPMMEIPWEYIEEYIVKHSFNIINLIEINDIVNESLVVNLYKILKDINKPEEGMTEIIYLENGQEINKSNEIKTILTHEQYKRNCYVVKKEEEKDE